MRPEIGSEFHWDPAVLLDDERGGRLPGVLYATACGAMSALLRRLDLPGRLHVPSFFCMGVAEALGKDMPLAWYRHLPDGRGPRFATLEARPGDVVLAQNLFGREDGSGWRAWIDAHPGVTVLEDHSHDPFGPWATTSTAPYAVASLRKTLPVPDGAMLWSPRGLDVPSADGLPGEGAQLKLTAMLLKAAWLDGRPVPKETFRALQQRGEQALLGSDAPPSAFTAAVLPLLDIAGIRTANIRNCRALASLLGESSVGAGSGGAGSRGAGSRGAGSGGAGPGGAGPGGASEGGACSSGAGSGGASEGGACSSGAGSGGAASFRLQLILPSERSRDALLAHLAARGIFAPVHWRQQRDGFWSGDVEAAALAARILTLPVDHRCGPAEVHRMAEAVSTAPGAGV